jgi:hypothetical protein
MTGRFTQKSSFVYSWKRIFRSIVDKSRKVNHIFCYDERHSLQLVPRTEEEKIFSWPFFHSNGE